ncbi:MAG: prepilin-type N-terminal cleavage/methylation domain-containing protein [Erysipelothrix sp.]
MKLIKKQNNKKGFTLIELVIVIAILAILALILIPAMSGYIGSANTSKYQADARSIYTAASVAAADPDNTDDAKRKEATADKANISEDLISIEYNEDKTVKSITYKPKDGKSITFDGKSFK